MRTVKRARKPLRKLKTYLGRTIRDVSRKIVRNKTLKAAFAPVLSRAHRELTQKRRQNKPKVYSMHAPEVECIGKGKAHKPYEFGVKVTVATTVTPTKGGQFIIHAKSLPGNPYDGHTLAEVIPDIERTTGVKVKRTIADAGYRGHNAPTEHKFEVYTQGQKRGVTEEIKRQFRRRAAVEPLIGHAKEEHRMGRNYLAGREGDAANAVLAAAGYNFRRLLKWLEVLLRLILAWLGGLRPLRLA